jgi:protein TonB
MTATFTEFNVRQDSGPPHFIRLEDQVVRAIERELAAPGAPLCGLLLGSISYVESRRIEVEQSRPAPSLEKGITEADPERLVGFYRTQPGAQLELAAQDFDLLRRCFPKGARLVLLLGGAGSGVRTAQFFLAENGRAAPDRCTVEFPFNLRALGAGGELEPLPAPCETEPAPTVPWRAALAGTAALGAVIGLFNFRTPPRVPIEPLPMERPAPPAPPARVEPRKPLPAGNKLNPPARETELRRPARRESSVPRIATPPPIATHALDADAPVLPSPSPLAAASAATVPWTAPGPPPPYTAPHAIRQVAPVLQKKIRRSIEGEAIIRLRVYVNRNGAVTGVDPLNATTSALGVLADAAIAAVRRWQFEPARRGSEPVAGVAELSFTFRK